MPHKIDDSAAIIKAGSKDCIHIEEIKNVDGELIGTCRKCGMEKNYSLLHRKIDATSDGNIHSEFKMDAYMKTAKGEVKKRYTGRGRIRKPNNYDIVKCFLDKNRICTNICRDCVFMDKYKETLKEKK